MFPFLLLSYLLTPPRRDERGMTTSEYAVGTVGAVTVALVLQQLAGSEWFIDLLRSVLNRALAYVLLGHPMPFRGIG